MFCQYTGENKLIKREERAILDLSWTDSGPCRGSPIPLEPVIMPGIYGCMLEEQNS